MVLLNLDAGEHDDELEELWAMFDVLSVACGGHAGDNASMSRVVAFCSSRARPRVGAHPSYPDREGFGRRSIAITPAALQQSIADQCAALAAVLRNHGHTGVVGWMKPHGALYHDCVTNEALAKAALAGALDGCGRTDIVVIGPPRGALRDQAAALGLHYLREGFADRNTRADGTLVPRSEPNALITNPIEAAARATKIATEVETICVHADTPNALAIARAVREAIDD